MQGRAFLAEGTDSTEALRQRGVQWDYTCERAGGEQVRVTGARPYRAEAIAKLKLLLAAGGRDGAPELRLGV